MTKISKFNAFPTPDLLLNAIYSSEFVKKITPIYEVFTHASTGVQILNNPNPKIYYHNVCTKLFNATRANITLNYHFFSKFGFAQQITESYILLPSASLLNTLSIRFDNISFSLAPLYECEFIGYKIELV